MKRIAPPPLELSAAQTDAPIRLWSGASATVTVSVRPTRMRAIANVVLVGADQPEAHPDDNRSVEQTEIVSS